ncbi:MAG: CPBP family intramembrane metalloprotease [Candidatus Rokubacteria bacterium]|nr:CPBP family intramembrane metalloprotease [Candidatus Rokubacteria bacterium]
MGQPGLELADDARPPGPAAPYFSGWHTLLCSVLVSVLVVIYAWPWPAFPLLQLDHPEESLERLVSSEMDLRAALEGAPAWGRALYALAAGPGEPVEESIVWYEELTDTLDAPRAEIYRQILLAEAGRLPAADPTLASAAWMRAAHGQEPPEADVGRAVIAEIRERLPENWFADRLVARVASRIGDGAIQAQAESAIAKRGAALLRRFLLLAVGQALLLALGLAALARLATRRPAAAIGEAPLPPRWPVRDGYALFVRGALGLLGVGVVASLLLPDGSPALRLAGFAAGLPMLWWAWHYLRAAGGSAATAFGLRLTPGGGGHLVTVTCALIGLGIAGDLGIAGAAGALGLRTHWADGFPEEILWDPPWLVAAGALDGGVWTPIVEEIAFRGVLFGTLRSAAGVMPAVVASAAIFAAAHGYGPAGFASALWSGILWAAAYERTRSLVPGLLAHGVNNVTVTVTYLWLYRV